MFTQQLVSFTVAPTFVSPGHFFSQMNLEITPHDGHSFFSRLYVSTQFPSVMNVTQSQVELHGPGSGEVNEKRFFNACHGRQQQCTCTSDSRKLKRILDVFCTQDQTKRRTSQNVLFNRKWEFPVQLSSISRPSREQTPQGKKRGGAQEKDLSIKTLGMSAGVSFKFVAQQTEDEQRQHTIMQHGIPTKRQQIRSSRCITSTKWWRPQRSLIKSKMYDAKC